MTGHGGWSGQSGWSGESGQGGRPRARSFRGVPRIGVWMGVFVLSAAFFAMVALVTAESAGWRIGAWLIVAVCLLGMARLPFMKAVATEDGLKLHGPVGNAFYPWNAIASISSAHTDTDGTLFVIRAPVLTLTNGKKIEVTAAGSYRGATAARIAAELESLRQAHSKSLT
jgi:hypothetical protein